MSKKDFAKIPLEEIDWATIPPEDIDWENMTYEQDQARMRFEIEQQRAMGEENYSPMPLVLPPDPPSQEDIDWVDNLLRSRGFGHLVDQAKVDEQSNS